MTDDVNSEEEEEDV